VNVNPVTASIDSDITANNIKTGVEILGVTGEVDELIGQTKTVTENGVYTPDDGYTGFTSVTVDTPPAIRREVKNGVYQMPTSSFTFSLPDDATDLGYYALYYAFQNCTGLTSVDLSSLTTINGSSSIRQAFISCTNLTSVDLSNLTAINNPYVLSYAFFGCTNLTSVDLSNLTAINHNHIFQSAFRSCEELKTLSFPSLKTILSNGTFNNMLVGVTGCTVHFPSNLQSVIGSWDDVVSGFGGTNTTVLFDLPATT
jgi:hypothetical protein